MIDCLYTLRSLAVSVHSGTIHHPADHSHSGRISARNTHHHHEHHSSGRISRKNSHYQDHHDHHDHHSGRVSARSTHSRHVGHHTTDASRRTSLHNADHQRPHTSPVKGSLNASKPPSHRPSITSEAGTYVDIGCTLFVILVEYTTYQMSIADIHVLRNI